jgi:hypothetical protein
LEERPTNPQHMDGFVVAGVHMPLDYVRLNVSAVRVSAAPVAEG